MLRRTCCSTFLLLALLATACAAPGRVRLVIEPDQIRETLEESFPVAQDLGLVSLELAEPELLLAEGADRIGLRFQVRVVITLVVVMGTVAAEGKLRYQPEEATFYVDEPRVLELALPGLPPDQAPEILATVNDLLAASVPKVPVYRLEEGTTRLLLRSARVEGGRLVVELGL